MTTSGEYDSADTRGRIKAVAAELYVRQGHDSFSFGDIAGAIGTTRANIHHHFGSKRQLMEALIADIADDAQLRIEAHWTGQANSFDARLDAQIADLQHFYLRFNPADGDRNVWSPLSRLRHDLSILGEPARRALEQVNQTYDRALRSAVLEAIERGEFHAATPVDDVVRLLRVTLLACPPITQDAGTFEEVVLVITALKRTIKTAFARLPGA